MEKKVYIAPETTVVTVALQQMIAFSGGSGDPTTSIVIDPSADTSPEPSKSRWDNDWDDDWDEDF